MKTILYIGGFFDAEYSMWHSFKEHNVEIIFIQEPEYPQYNEPLFPNILYSANLPGVLAEYKPDLVIHRYCSHFSGVYGDCSQLVSSFGIPYIVYRIESCFDTLPQTTPIKKYDCDLFLYANHIDIPFLNQDKQAFWSWGVSTFDKNRHIERDIPFAGFGKAHEFNNRRENLKTFVAGCAPDKVTVFWGSSVAGFWSDLFAGLDIRLGFDMKDQIVMMNRTNIALNFETCPHIHGVYSYKLFQTMACGTPTISFHKQEYKDMFEGALLEVESSDDISKAIDSLNNKDTWEEVSRKSEAVLHRKFDWYTNFKQILQDFGMDVL